MLLRALKDFDVVHFNFGSSIFPPRPVQYQPHLLGRQLGMLLAEVYRSTLCMRDLALLKRAGKAIFVTYQGDDARQGDYCRAHFDTHFVHEVETDYYPEGSDAVKRKAISAFARFADGIFALNPDLLYVLPAHANFVPYANVDVKEWQPVPVTGNAGRPLSIVHAPSHRLVKGSRYLFEAVTQLKAEGVSIELKLVENLPRSEARALYERADVVVDQLLAGWYGGLAVEAMALAKPVIAYLREADLRFVPEPMRRELPIINANPQTIRAVLKSLATMERDTLAEIGLRSRVFVEKWHDPERVAAMMVEHYSAALVRQIEGRGRPGGM